MTDVIGLRFVATGEAEITRAYERYSKTTIGLQQATRQVVSAIDSMQAGVQRAGLLFEQGRISSGNYAESLRETKRQYAALADVSIQKASAEVERFANALKEAERIRLDDAARLQFEQLVASMNPMTAATERFQAGMKVVNDALGRHVIMAGEAERAQQQLRASLDAALQAPRNAAAEAYDRLRASIDPTVAAQLRLEAAQNTVNAAIERGVVTPEQGAETLRQYTAALHDTSKANELLRRRTDELTVRYNPAKAATQAYARAQDDLTFALRQGIITEAQYRAELAKLDAQMAAVQRGTISATKFITQFGTNARIAGTKTNTFGLYAQQAGYQIGDFFVQIQSGTNAFVAFGQQATQLAGLFAGVTGAIAGIGISVATMFLAMWDRTRQARRAAEEAKSSFDDLGNTIDRLDKLRFAELQTTLAQVSVTADAAFRPLLETLTRVESSSAEAMLKSLLGPLRAAVDDHRRAAESLTVNEFGPIPGGGGVPRYELMGVPELGLNADAANTAMRLLEQLRIASREAMTEQLAGIAAELTQRKLNTAEVEALIKRLSDQLRVGETIAQMEKERADTAKAHSAAATQRIDELHREITMSMLTVRYGENSTEVEAERLANAMRLTEEFIAQNEKMTEGEAIELRASTERAFKQKALEARVTAQLASNETLKAETELLSRQIVLMQNGVSTAEARARAEYAVSEAQLKQKLAADGLTAAERDALSVALQKLQLRQQLQGVVEQTAAAEQQRAEARNFVEGLEAETQLLRIQLGLLQQGVAYEDAQRLATIELHKAKIALLVTEGKLTAEKGKQLSLQLAQLAAEQADLKKAIASFKPPSISAGAGVGAAETKETLESIVAELDRRIEREETLLRLTGAERVAQELYYDITDRLRSLEIPFLEEKIRLIVQERAARKQVMDDMKRQEQIQKDIARTLTDLFMAGLDGADAFRQAIINVIQQLMQMQLMSAFQAILSATGVAGPGSFLFRAFNGGFATGGAGGMALGESFGGTANLGAGKSFGSRAQDTAQDSGRASNNTSVVYNIHVTTADAQSFANSRATVVRGARRLADMSGRYM